MVNTISVAPGFIGTKNDRNNLLTYSITGTMSTITEKVNGTVVNTKTATSGQSLIAGLTQAQWDAVKYGKYKDATGGSNTLTVEMGTDIWTYTFDKRLATDADVLSAVKAVQDSQNTYLPSVKAKLASAIRGKGGTVNDVDSWDAMVSAVGGIVIPKKASGTTTVQAAVTFTYYDGTTTSTTEKVTVTGLSFKPSYILLQSGSISTVYDARFGVTQRIWSGATRGTVSPTNWIFQEAGNAIVNSDGFTLPMESTVGNSVNWIAFE